MNRIKQPSTWAGFATLAQMFGAMFPQYAMIAHALTVGAGALAVGLNEQPANA